MPVAAPRIATPPSTYLLRAGLIGTLAFAVYGLTWLGMAPNRLLPGQPVSAVQALGLAAHGVIALALFAEIAALRSRGAAVAAVILVAALALTLWETGAAAKVLLHDRPPAARAYFGAGFWLACAAMVGLAFEHGREAGRFAVPAIAALILAIVAAGILAGRFDSLSLMVEYKARMASVHAAFQQHIVLSLSALVLAVLVALPLGWASFRSERIEALVNAVLSAVQVTPAIALFGLLIPLLAGLLAAAPRLRGLGLSAIGPAPALIGVSIYLALPLLRGLVSGLRATEPAVVEAAQAMGMTEARMMIEVRVPLGLPILVGALRVAAVQSIGLMVLGGLIGAGGLGAIVFEGMSQLAPDLIVLGAIPIVGLALAVDAGMVGLNRAFGSSQ